MKNFTVPDICDENDNLQISELFLTSFGAIEKFYGQICTAKCEHSNSIVKELVQNDGEGKVLCISHTGSDLCSMVGDQIAKTAVENNWNGIITNGYVRDIEVIKNINIGLYAFNSYPKKTDKSKGTGEKNVSIQIGNVNIKPGYWIYVDTNGWVVASKELEL